MNKFLIIGLAGHLLLAGCGSTSATEEYVIKSIEDSERKLDRKFYSKTLLLEQKIDNIQNSLTQLRVLLDKNQKVTESKFKEIEKRLDLDLKVIDAKLNYTDTKFDNIKSIVAEFKLIFSRLKGANKRYLEGVKQQQAATQEIIKTLEDASK